MVSSGAGWLFVSTLAISWILQSACFWLAKVEIWYHLNKCKRNNICHYLFSPFFSFVQLQRQNRRWQFCPWKKVFLLWIQFLHYCSLKAFSQTNTLISISALFHRSGIKLVKGWGAGSAPVTGNMIMQKVFWNKYKDGYFMKQAHYLN